MVTPEFMIQLAGLLLGMGIGCSIESMWRFSNGRAVGGWRWLGAAALSLLLALFLIWCNIDRVEIACRSTGGVLDLQMEPTGGSGPGGVDTMDGMAPRSGHQAVLGSLLRASHVAQNPSCGAAWCAATSGLPGVGKSNTPPMDGKPTNGRYQRKDAHWLKNDRDRLLERLNMIATVLKRYNAYPDYTGLEKYQEPIADERAAEARHKHFAAIAQHLRLHAVALGKHEGLEFTQDGTLMKFTVDRLPTIIADARSAFNGTCEGLRALRTGGPSPRALGPFQTDEGRELVIGQLEKNLATATKSRNKDLIANFSKLLESAKSLSLYPCYDPAPPREEEEADVEVLESAVAEDPVRYGYNEAQPEEQEPSPFKPCASCGRDELLTAMMLNRAPRPVWMNDPVTGQMVCLDCGVPMNNQRVVAAHNTAAA